MKTFTILALTLGAGLTARSQGTVYFSNRVVGSVVAPVYGLNPDRPWMFLRGNANTNGGTVDYTGCPLLSGTGWSASLWAGYLGTGPDDFRQLAMTTFRTNPSLAGFIQPVSQVTIPWVPVGQTPVNFQMRIWDNVNGTITTWTNISRLISSVVNRVCLRYSVT